mmetsp:Transcript_61363/g.126719  ORF Transcript_61363/g.126719 Transcript_61363/m.126719 type:complete len:678 (+) Transcript_61363:11-2044(+)
MAADNARVEWSFEGQYLTVSKLSFCSPGAGASTSLVNWSHAGEMLALHRVAEYATEGDGAPSAPTVSVPSAAAAGGAASSGANPAKSAEAQLQEAEEYLQRHQVQARIEKAMNEVLSSMPADPMAMLADVLKTIPAQAPGGGEAPAEEAAVDNSALEAERDAQADLVKELKLKKKADDSAVSQEEVDTAVKKLLEIKAKLGDDGKKKGDKKADKKADKKGGAKKGKEAGPKMIDVEPCMGTRDFYPEDMRIRNWMFGHFRAVAKQFAFQEYDAPVLESEELYKRKAGEEITQQMYNFVDKGGYAVTLRPEMTPSLARMILARQRADSGQTMMILPVKWFSIPQCWRFETTQRGRKREHYQWNMDIVGVKTIGAETELLAAITAFFTNVGITSADVGIKVNSRKVMGSILKAQGISDDQFAPVCVVVDKLDKIGPEEVVKELVAPPLCVPESTAQTIIKTMAARSVEELKAICGPGVDQEGLDELAELFEQAKEYGFADFLIFDASVVRGLAYYTGIVFECFDRSGELRAICGGGRYDRLLSLYGSKQEVPCVGFGFGDCVILELLQMKNCIPRLDQTTDFVVAAFNQEMLKKAMHVAGGLRTAGAVVDMQCEPKKNVGKTFDYANRVGARFVALVAPDEWNKGMVRVKDLRADDKTNNQKDVLLDDLANWTTIFPDA